MQYNFKTEYRKEDFAYIVSTPDGWTDLYHDTCLPLLEAGRFDELGPHRLGETSDLIAGRRRGTAPSARVEIPAHVLKSKMPLRSPITVQIEATLECNLRCKHCFNHSLHARQDEMTTREICDLLSELRGQDVMSIVFTGGEITLRHDFVEIVQHARNLGLTYFIQTHGGFLTPELLRQVPEKSYFIISFDGIKSHRRVHGGAMAPAKMMDLFARLKEHGFPFSAQYVARRENLEELPETYRWCADNEVDFAAIDLYPTGRAMKWPDIFPTREQIPLFKDLARAKFDYELAQQSWILDGSWDGADNPYHFTFIGRMEQIFERSFSGVFFAYVASNGDVYPDNFHGGDGHFCAGNLRQQSFTELWNSSFKEIRELVLWDNWPECRTCPLSQGYCDYRLPVYSYNLHGRYNVCGATDVFKEVSLLRDEMRAADDQRVLSIDAARSLDTW